MQTVGVGEFLSSKAENEWILSERRRENWEMENYPEGEINEMIDIYEERGMSREDATQVITTMSKYQNFFVDVMMAEELGLQVPEEDHKTESMKEGVVMFCSFATFGSLPVLGYVIIPGLFPSTSEDALFAAACVVTGLVLFGMGCVKSIFRYVSYDCPMCWAASFLSPVAKLTFVPKMQCRELVHLWDGNASSRRCVCNGCIYNWSVCGRTDCR